MFAIYDLKALVSKNKDVFLGFKTNFQSSGKNIIVLVGGNVRLPSRKSKEPNIFNKLFNKLTFNIQLVRFYPAEKSSLSFFPGFY